MNFLKDIKSAIYDKSFYQGIKNISNKQAWTYFIKISLVQAVLLTLVFMVLVVPIVNNIFSEESKTKIVNYFPEELTFNIKQGKASTNVEEPYVIPYSDIEDTEDITNAEDRENRSENFMVIDTVSTFSLELFENSKADVLITKENIVTRKSNGQVTIQPLSSFPDVELNRVKIFDWITKAEPFFMFVVPVTVVFYFIVILIGSFIGNTIFLLIASLVVLAIIKLQKKTLEYSVIYRQGLYAITALMVIEVLAFMFGLDIGIFASLLLFQLSYFINTHETTVTPAKVENPDQSSQ